MSRLIAAILAALALGGCAADPPGKGGDLEEAARLNTQLGIDYMRKGQPDYALEKLQRAIAQDPDYAVAHSSIAFVYQTKGEFKLAERHYRTALSLDAENPAARNNFGVFLCGRGEYAEAEEYFLQAAQDKRYATPEAAYTNAGICAKQYNAEKAQDYFRRALEANPEFADALAQMALVSFKQKDHLRTRAFLQRYEAVGKPTPEVLWLAVQNETALGDDLAVRKYQIRLRREFPDSAETAQLDKP